MNMLGRTASCIGAVMLFAACGQTPFGKSLRSGSSQGPQRRGKLIPVEWERLENGHVNAADYQLVSFPSKDVDKAMIPGSQAQGVPTNLQGIWWMDGNPLAPGNVTSFAAMLWDQTQQQVLALEYGQNNYTYNDDDSGRASFAQTIEENAMFEVHFDKTYTSARLIQVMNQAKLPIEDIDYTMELVRDGDWVRHSGWSDHRNLPDYHLRRIVDAAGHRIEPVYSAFLAAAPEHSLLPKLKHHESNRMVPLH